MRFVQFAAILLCLAACNGASQQPAKNSGSVAVGVSTLGLTLEPSYRVSKHFGGRALLGTGSLSGEQEADGITYDANVNLGGFGAMADFYPGGGSLRLSGGVLAQNLEVEGRATGTVDVGSNTFVGVDLTTRITPENEVAPIIAIGIDQPVSDNFSFTADLGAIFVGGYTATLSDSTNIVPASDIQAEVNALEDELNNAPVIPYVKIGGAFTW